MRIVHIIMVTMRDNIIITQITNLSFTIVWYWQYSKLLTIYSCFNNLTFFQDIPFNVVRKPCYCHHNATIPQIFGL
jgi:hypothetical protein